MPFLYQHAVNPWTAKKSYFLIELSGESVENQELVKYIDIVFDASDMYDVSLSSSVGKKRNTISNSECIGKIKQILLVIEFDDDERIIISTSHLR